jgi:acyl-CoA reductase-like NAD-dependent aldehyde dehydrogenase
VNFILVAQHRSDPGDLPRQAEIGLVGTLLAAFAWRKKMEMKWSRWFRCESSFELLLVPNQPGVFALAEEVAQATGPYSRRMLAVFDVQEADDLSRAMSRLFATGSGWREKLAQARCYVRYAVAPSIADRRAAASALKTWLNSHREVAAQVFEQKTVTTGGAAERCGALEEIETELKTVAERAVDRVTHGIKLSKQSAVEV